MLRRYPNLVLPFIDEITRLPAITDVVAEISGLILFIRHLSKMPNPRVCILHQDLHYWVWNQMKSLLGRINAGLRKVDACASFPNRIASVSREDT